MVQVLKKLVTFEEFLETYPDNGGIYELIKGEVIEINPTGRHEEIIAFIVFQLNLEIHRQKLRYFLPITCTIKPLIPNTGYNLPLLFGVLNSLFTSISSITVNS